MTQKDDQLNRTIIAGLALLAICGAGIAAFVTAATVEHQTPSQAIAAAAEDPMLARPCKKAEACNQTWTLTSRLGHILETYEALIGRRNPAYRILGVEFTTSGRPRTWYPDFGKGPRHIIIQLTQQARRNGSLALFQLGHEVFHLIEPISPNSHGSYFEEGLANYFAIEYLKNQNIAVSKALISEASYREAYQLVARLAALHKDFYSRLKRFRELHHSFSDISADAIRDAFPDAPAQIIQQLARPFITASGANAQ